MIMPKDVSRPILQSLAEYLESYDRVTTKNVEIRTYQAPSWAPDPDMQCFQISIHALASCIRAGLRHDQLVIREGFIAGVDGRMFEHPIPVPTTWLLDPGFAPALKSKGETMSPHQLFIGIVEWKPENRKPIYIAAEDIAKATCKAIEWLRSMPDSDGGELVEIKQADGTFLA